MEKLTIELDCDEKTCGKCYFIDRCHSPTLCYLYNEYLNKNSLLEFIRLPECIAACKAQKEKK